MVKLLLTDVNALRLRFFQKLKKLKPLFNFKYIITGSKLIVRFCSKNSHESIGKTGSKKKQYHNINVLFFSRFFNKTRLVQVV